MKVLAIRTLTGGWAILMMALLVSWTPLSKRSNDTVKYYSYLLDKSIIYLVFIPEDDNHGHYYEYSDGTFVPKNDNYEYSGDLETYEVRGDTIFLNKTFRGTPSEMEKMEYFEKISYIPRRFLIRYYQLIDITDYESYIVRYMPEYLNFFPKDYWDNNYHGRGYTLFDSLYFRPYGNRAANAPPIKIDSSVISKVRKSIVMYYGFGPDSSSKHYLILKLNVHEYDSYGQSYPNPGRVKGKYGKFELKMDTLFLYPTFAYGHYGLRKIPVNPLISVDDMPKCYLIKGDQLIDISDDEKYLREIIQPNATQERLDEYIEKIPKLKYDMTRIL